MIVTPKLSALSKRARSAWRFLNTAPYSVIALEPVAFFWCIGVRGPIVLRGGSGVTSASELHETGASQGLAIVRAAWSAGWRG